MYNNVRLLSQAWVMIFCTCRQLVGLPSVSLVHLYKNPYLPWDFNFPRVTVTQRVSSADAINIYYLGYIGKSSQ